MIVSNARKNNLQKIGQTLWLGRDFYKEIYQSLLKER